MRNKEKGFAVCNRLYVCIFKWYKWYSNLLYVGLLCAKCQLWKGFQEMFFWHSFKTLLHGSNILILSAQEVHSMHSVDVKHNVSFNYYYKIGCIYICYLILYARSLPRSIKFEAQIQQIRILVNEDRRADCTMSFM